MKESKYENVLATRRKTQQIFTTQDLVSMGITNRAQEKMLRASEWAMDRITNPRKARIE